MPYDHIENQGGNRKANIEVKCGPYDKNGVK